MENNNMQKKIWIGVAIIVVIGLIMIARKGKDPEVPVVVDNTQKIETATTTTQEVKPVVRTTPKATVVDKKPTGNVVELTSTGFKPFILQVKKGESVEFLNSSDKAMVIRSHDNKPENFYPGFSQESGPLGKGGRFYFAFTTAGDWSYYNLNTKQDEGVISVR